MTSDVGNLLRMSAASLGWRESVFDESGHSEVWGFKGELTIVAH